MLLEELKKASIQALKEHNTISRGVLSVVLNKIKLMEIAKRETPNSPMTDGDILAILQKTVKELKEEQESYITANRPDRANEILEQSKVVESFLPQMMTSDEIKQIILKLEDNSLPFVMRHFKEHYQGKCDMRLVQTIASGK